MGVAHLLNRTLAVWRPSTVDDGSGGQAVTFAQVGEVRALVAQPTAEERQVAMQWGAEHTHNVLMSPDADVRRGDELRGDGQTFQVVATVTPSRAVYLKAPASERLQAEGT